MSQFSIEKYPTLVKSRVKKGNPFKVELLKDGVTPWVADPDYTGYVAIKLDDIIGFYFDGMLIVGVWEYDPNNCAFGIRSWHDITDCGFFDGSELPIDTRILGRYPEDQQILVDYENFMSTNQQNVDTK